MADTPISVTTTNGAVAVTGKSTGTSVIGIGIKAGLLGLSDVGGIGVYGQSIGVAVRGECIDGTVSITGSGPGSEDGVYGTSGGNGVHGLTFGKDASGVWGENKSGVTAGTGNGVTGNSNQSGGSGVWGVNRGGGIGVTGTSNTGNGVVGQGVNGVMGQGTTGVRGVTNNPTSSGVQGENTLGGGSTGNGVTGLCNQSGGSGVWGNNTGGGAGVAGNSDAPGGVGIYGRGARLAARFEGNVEVTGDLSLVSGDCAEDFDIAGDAEVEPGTVMAIDNNGSLEVCDSAYNKRVAGVLAGAGNLKPAIILGKQESATRRMPVALVGKVYCKVDAVSSPIEVGDLLTTSSTPGYAMKASDASKSSGAVIGKALGPCESGLGLIPILVALQ
jgi:hypothetical protein